MGNPSAAHEPSMEEILASIRQIISDDGDQSQDDGAPSEADGASASAQFREADEAEAHSPERQGGESHESSAPPDHEAPKAAAAATRSPEAPQRPEASLRHQSGLAADAPSGDLLQHHSNAAAAAAKPAQPAAGQGKPSGGGNLGMPVAAMTGADAGRLLSPHADASVSGAFSALAHTILAQNARTLEDLVSEMLRPMLKDWLDDNLPPLVERLVKEEIERVSRGRR